MFSSSRSSLNPIEYLIEYLIESLIESLYLIESFDLIKSNRVSLSPSILINWTNKVRIQFEHLKRRTELKKRSFFSFLNRTKRTKRTKRTTLKRFLDLSEYFRMLNAEG